MKLLLALAAVIGSLAMLVAQPAAAVLSQTEIRGKIVKVTLGPDGQPPRLLVQPDQGVPRTVLLGSFRYLMDQDFNPKAGQQVKVRGFARAGDEMLAASVTMLDTGKELKLRDEQGRPVWRRQGRRP